MQGFDEKGDPNSNSNAKPASRMFAVIQKHKPTPSIPFSLDQKLVAKVSLPNNLDGTELVRNADCQ